MKFSAQEEYGLRCLIRIGKYYQTDKSQTIPEISKAEGLTQHNVGKILRLLRINGFLQSVRGQTGGYTLSKPPEKIVVGEVLTALGGRLFDGDFCRNHSGKLDICTNSADCSIRSLWKIIQDAVDGVVNRITLKDLMASENESFVKINENSEIVNTDLDVSN